MPDVQEIIALGIVALVAGGLLWRRWFRARASGKAGACGDCASAGPPPKEAPVRFYRRPENAEGPASGAPKKQA